MDKQAEACFPPPLDPLGPRIDVPVRSDTEAGNSAFSRSLLISGNRRACPLALSRRPRLRPLPTPAHGLERWKASAVAGAVASTRLAGLIGWLRGAAGIPRQTTSAWHVCQGLRQRRTGVVGWKKGGLYGFRGTMRKVAAALEPSASEISMVSPFSTRTSNSASLVWNAVK